MEIFWNWLKWILRGFLTPAWPKRKKIRAVSGTIEGVPLVDLSLIPSHGARHAVDFGFLPQPPICARCGVEVDSADHFCQGDPMDLAYESVIGNISVKQCQHYRVTRTPNMAWCNDCGLINPPMPKVVEGS